MRIETIDRARWLELAAGFADLNYRQCWDFGVACAQRVGGRSEHVAVLDGGDVVGLADVRVKTVPVLDAGIAYVNGGPLVRRPGGDGDSSRLEASIAALTEEYVERRGLVLRVAPAPAAPDWSERLTEVYAAQGFACGDTQEETILVDISPSLEDVRMALYGKWRRSLKQSESAGHTIRCGTDAETFEGFIALFDGMIERKGFSVNLHPRLYADVQSAAADAEKFHVVLVEYEGQPVAGHVASMVGDTCVSLLGASEGQGRKTRASYLVQWHLIETAKARGCRWYDLGGIDPIGNPGVYQFKKGLGGVEIRVAGPFEKSAQGLKARVAGIGERLFRAVRARRG